MKNLLGYKETKSQSKSVGARNLSRILVGLLFLTFLGQSSCILSSKEFQLQKDYSGASICTIYTGFEVEYYKIHGKFATDEELVATGYKSITEDSSNYQFELYATKDWFSISAKPKKDRANKLSFYIDSTDGNLHGADHQGQPASNQDPIVIEKKPEWQLPLLGKK